MLLALRRPIRDVHSPGGYGSRRQSSIRRGIGSRKAFHFDSPCQETRCTRFNNKWEFQPPSETSHGDEYLLGLSVISENHYMNLLRFVPFILLPWICTATAQLSTPEKKPPVGIPSDAKLFNGKWYRVYLERTSWANARQKCTALRGQLVVITDEPTWEFVNALTQGAALWLGATDEQTEGVWKWVDGTPVTLKPWFQGQPDNARGVENYLATYKNLWNDAPKAGEFMPRQFVVGYICEWKDK